MWRSPHSQRGSSAPLSETPSSAMTNENQKDGPPVTVIGLGLMGAARALVDAGHQTTVWNRLSAKADALVAAGATRAKTVADAVAASPLVIACVLDDAALRSVLDPVAGELSGRTLVNLTSDTPARQRRGRASTASTTSTARSWRSHRRSADRRPSCSTADHRTPSPRTSRRWLPWAAPPTSAPTPGWRRSTTSVWSA
jgi:hypothetical protein